MIKTLRQQLKKLQNPKMPSKNDSNYNISRSSKHNNNI